MPFTQTIQPQFRDADEDGLIGLCGCMRYFQDIHTWYMHDIDKGNDVLPERYGAAWVYRAIACGCSTSWITRSPRR